MTETLNTVLWLVTRSSALAATVLLTAVVVLGAVVAVRRQRPRASDAVVIGVHRTISLLASGFVLAHVITSIVETYVDLGWLSLVVPFTSGYAPFAVGLGTIAFDLLLAVMITGLLRHRLPSRVFRVVHWLSYALWPIALLHGALATSTDGTLVTVVAIVCAVAGAVAIGWRSLQGDDDGQARARAHDTTPARAGDPAAIGVPVSGSPERWR